MALANHPEVQLKARAELNAVLGPLTFPHPDDIERLPYIQAVMTELKRWNVIAPFSTLSWSCCLALVKLTRLAGLPHLCRHDDEYKGYFIPAGTLLMPNNWYACP